MASSAPSLHPDIQLYNMLHLQAVIKVSSSPFEELAVSSSGSSHEAKTPGACHLMATTFQAPSAYSQTQEPNNSPVLFLAHRGVHLAECDYV